jgi:hypothetical protein
VILDQDFIKTHVKFCTKILQKEGAVVPFLLSQKAGQAIRYLPIFLDAQRGMEFWLDQLFRLYFPDYVIITLTGLQVIPGKWPSKALIITRVDVRKQQVQCYAYEVQGQGKDLKLIPFDAGGSKELVQYFDSKFKIPDYVR